MTERIQRAIPTRIKKIMSDLLGITGVNKRVDLLYELIESELSAEAKQRLWERSRARWRKSEPNPDLTWKMEISGDDFMSKLSSYGVFGSEKSILEIGAGYGRLLRSCLRLGIPFKRYTAIDISSKNVDYLREHFQREDIQIVLGDVEKVSFNTRFDVVYSSLTFKHLYPSFEKALRNVANFANPGCMFFFDLIEGERRGFESDGTTYSRWYTRSEILGILSRTAIEFVAFDQVRHAPGYSRLLVIARQTAHP